MKSIRKIAMFSPSMTNFHYGVAFREIYGGIRDRANFVLTVKGELC